MWFRFNLAFDIVLPYFGRNSFWNLYQYFGRKFFCKFNLILLQLCILLYVWEEIYSIMFNNICGENSSESCTWYCYHNIPYFIIWEEIYSEICTNIWEGISSESFTLYCYYQVSYFMIWEEIYSENCTNMWGEYSSERCTWYFLPLCIILLCLGRNLFRKLYQYLGRKFFWKLYLILLPLYTLL